MIFEVKITESEVYILEIDADSPHEAMEKAEEIFEQAEKDVKSEYWNDSKSDIEVF